MQPATPQAGVSRGKDSLAFSHLFLLFFLSFLHPSIHLFIQLFIQSSKIPVIHRSNYPSIHLFICPYICPYINHSSYTCSNPEMITIFDDILISSLTIYQTNQPTNQATNPSKNPSVYPFGCRPWRRVSPRNCLTDYST